VGRYNENSANFGSTLLPIGEHRFLIVGGEEKKSAKGNRYMALKLLTRCDGRNVTRYHNVTFTSDERRNFCVMANLLDAIGSNPNDPKIEAAIDAKRYQAGSFVKEAPKLELTAWVKHEIYQGETRDTIDFLVSRMYRKKFVEGRRAKGFEVTDEAPGAVEEEQQAVNTPAFAEDDPF